MAKLPADSEGYLLSLRRPLSGLADAELPPTPTPFNADAEIAIQRDLLNRALARIPAQHLETFRKSALEGSRSERDPDLRRAHKRHAGLIFEHMVERGLKPAGPLRPPEDIAFEQLALRNAVFSLLAMLVPDEQLLAANRAATEGWMALPDPEDSPHETAVLGYAFRAESKLYMEVMDANGTTERFLARQPGRAH
jgi:hypothetical protein